MRSEAGSPDFLWIPCKSSELLLLFIAAALSHPSSTAPQSQATSLTHPILSLTPTSAHPVFVFQPCHFREPTSSTTPQGEALGILRPSPLMLGR